MNMMNIFSAALGIKEPWYVEDVSFNAQKKRLDIKINFRRGTKFMVPGVAGSYTAYDTVEKTWRHLNFFEHECYLTGRIPRVKSDDGSMYVIDPEWSGMLNGFTLLFEALILQLASSMPIHQLSKIIKISDYKIWSILDKYVDNAREFENYAKVSKIGIDETSISRGHNYLTLFV